RNKLWQFVNTGRLPRASAARRYPTFKISPGMLRKRRCCARCQRAVDVTTSDALHHVTVAVDTNASTVWSTSAGTTKMAFRQRSHKLNTTRTVPPILHYCTMSMELSATSWHLLV